MRLLNCFQTKSYFYVANDIVQEVRVTPLGHLVRYLFQLIGLAGGVKDPYRWTRYSERFRTLNAMSPEALAGAVGITIRAAMRPLFYAEDGRLKEREGISEDEYRDLYVKFLFYQRTTGLPYLTADSHNFPPAIFLEGTQEAADRYNLECAQRIYGLELNDAVRDPIRERIKTFREYRGLTKHLGERVAVVAYLAVMLESDKITIDEVNTRSSLKLSRAPDGTLVMAFKTRISDTDASLRFAVSGPIVGYQLLVCPCGAYGLDDAPDGVTIQYEDGGRYFFYCGSRDIVLRDVAHSWLQEAIERALGMGL